MSNLKRYTLYILNIIDILSIVISHLSAYYLRTAVFTGMIPFEENAHYSDFLLLSIIAYVLYNITVMYGDERFAERGTFEEIQSSLKLAIFLISCTVLYLYAVKQGETFSRIYVFMFAALLFVIDSSLRIGVKKLIIPKIKSTGAVEDVLIVTDSENAAVIFEKVEDRKDWRYQIKGCVITDADLKGTQLSGIDVISDREHMFEDIRNADIDSVLIVPGYEERAVLTEWIRRFQSEGKIVHVEIREFDLGESVKTLDHMGDAAIVTYRVISAMPKRQQLFKRILCFAGALLLMPIFLVTTMIVAVFSRLESSGRILVPRVRIGKNNRRFYQYRYRVYRIDAQERIKNGRSPYTKIGSFLKTSHLDGLPMLLNVLLGDMSFVGPKSPNLQRYLQMDARQRNTLSVPPGMIGYWSCEDDSDKEVQLEQRYIEGWHIGKDVSIILRTAAHYLSGNSLRRDGDTHVQEELDYVSQIREEMEPMVYDRSTYTCRTGLGYGFYMLLKRALDMLLSLAGIIVLSPLFIILTLVVMLDDGGNPFYSHKRVGKDGRRIRVYKFRSMRMDAGDLEKLLTPEQFEQYRREFKIDNDPRITRIGEFMRRTSLDELPQLFNILGGSLSIVGPRPVTEDEIRFYGNDAAKLLSVKPGLTGYWQAYARNNAEYETGERQKMEMYYVDHQSLWLDLRVFFKTFGTVISREGAQ